ncbi:MAG: translation initiation factor IF-2 [Oscillatoria sp. SIO1A7]|nr:translation initiation factor IF-2 [Oscillatoria sp. SIO1A7]
MNHGKVRIYELSRELNLDNKDILAVCEKLNIAVKSHSSTITEDEAGRIRAYSEKYMASQQQAKASATEKSQENGELPEEDSLSPGKKKKLEIRKYKSRDRDKRSGANSPPNQKPDTAELEPPARQEPDLSPMNQTHLSRPLHPSQINETSKVASAPNAAPSKQASQSNSESQSDLKRPTNVSPPTARTQTNVEKPTRTGPPQPPRRPEPPKPISQPARPTGGNKSTSSERKERPILKQDKRKPVAQPKVAKAGANAEPGSAPKPKNKPPVPRNKSAPTKEGAGAKEPARATPAVPELQRPRRDVRGPNKFSIDAAEEEVLADVLGDGESEEILTDDTIKRPIPPKSLKNKGKKPKQKKEEEEDSSELSEKLLAKTGTKAKRRPKPIQDEDDDDLEGLNSRPSATPVSLSIARPPKAKSTATTPTPAPAKAKKPKTGDSGSRPSRNNLRREQPQKKQRPEEVVLSGSLTVRELADTMEIAETEIVKALFFKGIPVNITQTLDLDTATMVAEELGVEVITEEAESKAKKLREFVEEKDLDSLQLRPPVVTIMGHVDHGKTTLLDAIRNTKVAQGEAGGITQHIGAYHVDVEHKGQESQVVFLDTPGHEAFTAMRARGTRVTDIAILVVAADDGIQPQTLEAIGHAQAAKVPMIVAINKIDKEDAQPDRVKQELAERGLLWEEWGGDTIIVPISALKGQGLDELLEMILLVSEIEELSANPDRKAVGTVIEAHLDKAKGSVASLLVQNGTLRVGDLVVAGSAIGKVRAMTDDRGNRVEEARPSFAVEILGLGDVPAAGDEFEVFESEKDARNIAATRSDEKRDSRLQQAMASRRITLNSLSAQAKEGQLKELNLILKADVQGSLEAILQSLGQLPQGEVQIRVLMAAPGEVTETDVDLASASGAVILGFNTSLASGARQASDEAGVDVREYDIIYNLLDDVRGAMEGLLDPEMVEEPLGQAEVRAIFPVGKGAVAGCYIREGKMLRNCKVRVLRNGNVVHEGILDSLKRMKDDVREVNTGFECGIGLDSFKDWVDGDIIAAFRMVSKRRTLSDS